MNSCSDCDVYFYSAPYEYLSESVGLFVGLSVCLRSCFLCHASKLHQLLCACYLCPWLDLLASGVAASYELPVK